MRSKGYAAGGVMTSSLGGTLPLISCGMLLDIAQCLKIVLQILRG